MSDTNLKAQFIGTSSLSKTSLKLPLGQYSVSIQTLGASILAPTNLQRLEWSFSLKI